MLKLPPFLSQAFITDKEDGLHVHAVQAKVFRWVFTSLCFFGRASRCAPMNLTLTAVTSLNRIMTGLEPYSTQHCIMKGRLHYVCTVVLVTFTRLGDCWSYVATYLDVPASFYLMVCVVPSLLHLMDL